MRTILLFFTILFYVDANAQSANPSNSGNFLDMNGNLIDYSMAPLNAPLVNPAVASIMNYDTVRSLSEINTPGFSDAFPWISADGLRIYYDDSSKCKMIARPNTSSYFTAPVTVPLSVANLYSFWLSADELDIYFVSMASNLYVAHRTSTASAFSPATLITITGLPNTSGMRSASLNVAQDQLFVTFFGSPTRIAQLSRTSATSFNFVTILHLPTGYSPIVGQLSKDDKTFYLSAGMTSTQSYLYEMTRANVTDSFSISTFQIIQGINDTLIYNAQPSMSDSLSWVAFVRNPDNMWLSNDLYIAHGENVTSVFDMSSTPIKSSAFPNPANDDLSIRLENFQGNEVLLSIFSVDGKLISKKTAPVSSGKLTVDTQDLTGGIYFYQLSDATTSASRLGTGKFIVLHN